MPKINPDFVGSRNWSDEDQRDLSRCRLSGSLLWGYRSRFLAPRLLRLASRLESGPFYSFTLREILRRYHGVHVGAYSYGYCLVPKVIPSGVTVGRFSSIGVGLRAFLRNHPYDRLSMHPFFYNRACGIVSDDTISTATLAIEHDTWIGEQVVITPGCRRVGIGAVVGAGAVVTKDVPDFAIVAGNPARLIRMRFPESVCEDIRRSQWWNRPLSACRAVLPDMIRPLADANYAHPLLGEQQPELALQCRLESSCH